LLPHAVRFSGTTAAFAATPFSTLVGADAVPLANSANASAGDTTAPKSAPTVGDAGSPLPPQRTASSEWHASASRSKSAWHSAGHVAPASAQLYGVVISPVLAFTTTVCIAALCTY
jgi:hypothetical protein